MLQGLDVPVVVVAIASAVADVVVVVVVASAVVDVVVGCHRFALSQIFLLLFALNRMQRTFGAAPRTTFFRRPIIFSGV